MKFSDMMGKGEDGGTDVEEDAPPVSPAAPAPPLPEAPVQLGGNRSERPDEPAPAKEPLLSEVVAELAPRPDFTSRAGVSDEQLDATAWLEGLGTIDDDLLPR